jgi:hypothetical protein
VRFVSADNRKVSNPVVTDGAEELSDPAAASEGREQLFVSICSRVTDTKTPRELQSAVAQSAPACHAVRGAAALLLRKG